MNKKKTITAVLIIIASALTLAGCAASRNASGNIPGTQEEKTELKTEETPNQPPLHAPVVVNKRLPNNK